MKDLRKRLRRWRWWLVLGLFLLVYMTYRTVKSYREEAELARIIDRLDREDPGWAAEDLADRLKSPPAADNAAVSIMDLYATLYAGAWSRQFHGLTGTANIQRLATWTSEHPQARLPEFLRTTHTRALAIVPGPACLAKARQLRTFATGRFPVRHAPPFTSSARTFSMRSETIVRLLLMDGELHADANDLLSAWDNVSAILGCVRACGPDADLETSWSRATAGDGTVVLTQRILALGVGPSDVLRHVQDEFLKAERHIPALADTLRTERAVFDHDLRLLHEAKATLADVVVELFYFPHPGPLHKAPTGWTHIDEQLVFGMPYYFIDAWARPASWPRERSQLLTFFTEAVAWARHPEHELQSRWRTWRDTGSRVSPFFSAFFLRAHTREEYQQKQEYHRVLNWARYPHLQLKARFRAAATALAAERHRLDHGTWPTAWSQLTPTYLPLPLRDPYTGQPLILKVLPDGLVIYSVGDDEEDNGGDVLRGARTPRDVGLRLWNPDHRRVDLSALTKSLEDAALVELNK